MCLQAIARLSNHLSVEALYSRQSILYFIAPLTFLFSHIIAAVTLSLVALLHYPQSLSWIETLHQLMPELSRPSVRLLQGLLLGLSLTLVLCAMDMARFLGIGRHPSLKPASSN
jgi:hypothetical protein